MTARPTPPTSDAMPGKPRRRWFQFSLHTLLAAMVVLGFGSAWLGLEVKRGLDQRQAVHAFEAVGARIEFGEQHSRLRRNPWLRLGLQDMSGIWVYHSPVSDAEMARLHGLTKLETLNLVGAQVTDEGLTHSSGLT